jgi:hypothetical protein
VYARFADGKTLVVGTTTAQAPKVSDGWEQPGSSLREWVEPAGRCWDWGQRRGYSGTLGRCVLAVGGKDLNPGEQSTAGGVHALLRWKVDTAGHVRIGVTSKRLA